MSTRSIALICVTAAEKCRLYRYCASAVQVMVSKSSIARMHFVTGITHVKMLDDSCILFYWYSVFSCSIHWKECNIDANFEDE